MKITKFYLIMFCLDLYVFNSYSHGETVSSPYDTCFLGKLDEANN